MIAQSVLKRYKLDSDSLKPLFTKDSEKRDAKVNKLIELLCARIKDGRERQLRDYRTPAAIDLAYDAPFYQETPTLIRHVLSTCGNAEEVLKAATQWGLFTGDLFCKVKNKETQKDELHLNASMFYGVLVPVVRAYLTIRLAKLFNDRNGVPLFKYEPQKNTEQNRIRCEIITDLIQAISTQFGYSSKLRDLIFNTLLYSTAIMFPMEPWHEETQLDDNDKEIVSKRGIRYVVPHITRIFYDLQHPLSTMNTNTGSTYAGYWSIMRYGDLADDERYWNTKTVTYGYDWLGNNLPWANYFKTAYPCTLRQPTINNPTSSTDREKAAVDTFYTSNDYDKAVFVTHIFCKLVPKEWGLGDYKYPVWFRFTMASDDTVIWADSYSYNPLIVSLYDSDSNRVRNASLAQEIIPSQDLLGNMLNQYLLTQKRNLWNATFYDKNQITDEDTINDLKIHSVWQYQSVPFIPFDSAKDKWAQNPNRGEAFRTVTLPYADTASIIQGFSTVLNMLERLIGVSAQEIGSAASHQQSKAEILVISASTSNRVTYTGSFIDDARDAWKRQLYEGCLAHMPSDVVAQVSTNIPNLEKHLKVLGFKADEEIKGQRKVQVSGKMEKLALEGFASTKDSPDRGEDSPAAQAMFTALASINNNPRLSAVTDPMSMIDLYEIAARKMGADDDFNIKVNKDALAIQGVQEAMPQIAAALEKDIGEKVVAPITAELQKQTADNQAQDQQIHQLTQLVEKVVAQVQQITNTATNAPPLPSPPGRLDQPPDQSNATINGTPAGSQVAPPVGVA